MNDNIVSYVLSLFEATPTPLLVFLIFGVAIFILVNVTALIGVSLVPTQRENLCRYTDETRSK